MDEGCRKMSVSEPTFYRWRIQFVGMGVSEIYREAVKLAGLAWFRVVPVRQWASSRWGGGGLGCAGRSARARQNTYLSEIAD